MIGTVYLHPERTIVARWNIEDVPVLVGIDFFEPLQWHAPQPSLLSQLSASTAQCLSVRVAVPTSALAVHRFPTVATEANPEQSQFEIERVTASLQFAANSVLELPLPLSRFGYPHHALVFIPAAVTSAIEALTHVLPLERATVATAAVAASVAQLRHHNVERTIVIGRQRDRWEAFVVTPNGQIATWLDQPLDEGIDDVTLLFDMATSAASTIDVAIEHVVVFGDGITKTMVDDVQRRFIPSGCSVSRLQPFGSVRAALTSDDQAMLLRIAHVVSPIVGLLFLSSSTLDIPCALPAEH